MSANDESSTPDESSFSSESVDEYTDYSSDESEISVKSESFVYDSDFSDLEDFISDEGNIDLDSYYYQGESSDEYSDDEDGK